MFRRICFTTLIAIYLSIYETNKSKATFVSVGKYPDHQKSGINLQSCGLRRVPMVHNMSFNRKCFKNRFENITVWQMISTQNEIDDNSGKRIYQGDNVHLSESPWTLLVEVFWVPNRSIQMMSALCSGTLIAMDWLLTSAHCFDDWINARKAWAWIKGGSNDKLGTQISTVRRDMVFIHPLYLNGFGIRDIALIKLIDSFSQSYRSDNNYLLNAVCLPKRDQINEYNAEAIVTGFGMIDEYSMPYIMRKNRMNLLPFKDCSGFFCTSMGINDRKVCPGDSGGPLIQNIEKMGNKAVVFGITKGDKFRPKESPRCGPNFTSYNLWVAVPHIIDWIFETIDNFNKQYNVTHN